MKANKVSAFQKTLTKDVWPAKSMLCNNYHQKLASKVRLSHICHHRWMFGEQSQSCAKFITRGVGPAKSVLCKMHHQRLRPTKSVLWNNYHQRCKASKVSALQNSSPEVWGQQSQCFANFITRGVRPVLCKFHHQRCKASKVSTLQIPAKSVLCKIHHQR